MGICVKLRKDVQLAENVGWYHLKISRRARQMPLFDVDGKKEITRRKKCAKNEVVDIERRLNVRVEWSLDRLLQLIFRYQHVTKKQSKWIIIKRTICRRIMQCGLILRHLLFWPPNTCVYQQVSLQMCRALSTWNQTIWSIINFTEELLL